QPVLSYEAYRRIDPLPSASSGSGSSKLAGWEYVGAIPAHGETTYNMIVPTLADSTIAQGMHWSVFFVRAATASPALFYDSVPDSGYSMDNLAPSPPNNLVLNLAQLDWDAADETDFDYYRVYGSQTGILDGSQVLLGATSVNTYSVSSNSDPYYLVTTVDFAGNESPAATVANAVTGASSVPSRSIWLRVSPNPFNPATSIRFFLPQAAPLSLFVYDQRGRLVDTLFRAKHFSAGEHSVPYHSALPSGVYLLKLVSDRQVKSAKISLVR
ncbi:MAG TPA: T9SS type A sorting domain-containing protein, partial [Candidatus Krumholzibacteria bacterium]|nr:T9SS type A sorting domain-containing protein [Candidatus Krumholzibacteria bacterium]